MANGVPIQFNVGMDGNQAEAWGFFLDISAYPVTDTTLIDYNLGLPGYLRVKLTPAGHAILEFVAQGSPLTVDIANAAIPLNTVVYISFINRGEHGVGRFRFDGAIYLPGATALGSFTAYANGPNTYGQLPTYTAQFGWGMSTSSSYANFPQTGLGWMSKFRAFYVPNSNYGYPAPPSADAGGEIQDYMVRQPLGGAIGLLDTSGNGYHLVAGPQGVTINRDGPYISPFTASGVSAAELLDGHNPSMNCDCLSRAHTNNPVNSATGDFYHVFNDLSIPGRGISLQFMRTYNSLSANQDSPLGFGWADNDNAFLTTDTSGTITVTQENGSIVSFSPSGGSYIAPQRILAMLGHNVDGTFTLTRTNQTKLTFTAPTTTTVGQLIKETDRNGYVTAMTYTNGLLSTVADPVGRAFRFSYSGKRIAQIADPIGRTVAFTYDTSGNMTDARDVAGNVTHFAYYSGTHLMRTMTDSRNGVVTNAYDSLISGRVIAQTDALSRTTLLTYTPGANGAQTTTITDPVGNVTVEQYVNDELVSTTKGYGTPQAATWTYSYDPATLGVASTTDPNGHTSYNTYDANGNLLSHTDALGRTTSYAYDVLNDTTAITDPLGLLTTKTYDTNGNLLSVARPLTRPGGLLPHLVHATSRAITMRASAITTHIVAGRTTRFASGVRSFYTGFSTVAHRRHRDRLSTGDRSLVHPAVSSASRGGAPPQVAVFTLSHWRPHGAPTRADSGRARRHRRLPQRLELRRPRHIVDYRRPNAQRRDVDHHGRGRRHLEQRRRIPLRLAERDGRHGRERARRIADQHASLGQSRRHVPRHHGPRLILLLCVRHARQRAKRAVSLGAGSVRPMVGAADGGHGAGLRAGDACGQRLHCLRL